MRVLHLAILSFALECVQSSSHPWTFALEPRYRLDDHSTLQRRGKSGKRPRSESGSPRAHSKHAPSPAAATIGGPNRNLAKVKAKVVGPATITHHNLPGGQRTVASGERFTFADRHPQGVGMFVHTLGGNPPGSATVTARGNHMAVVAASASGSGRGFIQKLQPVATPPRPILPVGASDVTAEGHGTEIKKSKAEIIGEGHLGGHARSSEP